MTKDEHTLINEIKSGSEESYRILYDKWVSRLYNFVYQYIKSESVTDDIVQETFLKIWTNKESLNPEYSFKSYLFTIAYHFLIKELRRQINNPLLYTYPILTNLQLPRTKLVIILNLTNSEKLFCEPKNCFHQDKDRFLR